MAEWKHQPGELLRSPIPRDRKWLAQGHRDSGWSWDSNPSISDSESHFTCLAVSYCFLVSLSNNTGWLLVLSAISKANEVMCCLSCLIAFVYPLFNLVIGGHGSYFKTASTNMMGWRKLGARSHGLVLIFSLSCHMPRMLTSYVKWRD